ncbi:MAG: hypothetical protein K5660_07840 [Paludibacteraceae bacterium]|nr:hypothetical protein [Paludibacteraceae bacterium]
MKRTILAAIVLLIAEAFIVCAMLLIPIPIPIRVRILDMVVLSIVLWRVGYDLFRPLVNLAVKNPPEVGSLGVRWTGQISYLLFAIGFAIIGVIYLIPFVYQLLGQVLLVGLLLLTYYFAMHAAEMVKKVSQREDAVLEGREQMRRALSQIQDEITIGSNVPEYFRASINDMEDKLRYISPSDNADAISYEKQFADIATRVSIAMADFAMNEESIKQDILRMQRVLDNRKKVRN